MDPILIGLLGSVIFTVALSLLFRYEKRKNVRIFGKVRAYADVFVLRTIRGAHMLLRFIGRDLVRQIFHYLFHTFLRLVLAVVARCEEALRKAMQVNRTLARSVDEENRTRSKLEEIAFHKATHALSEEEKREHRERMLQGEA